MENNIIISIRMEMTENSIDLLRKSELFKSLFDDDLEYLLTRTEERSYKKGEEIFRVGGAAIQFYIVKSGEIRILQETSAEDTAAGNRTDLASYIAGDSFGEFDYITGSLYKVDAYAASDSVVIVFPAFPYTLDGLLAERPETIIRLYVGSITILSNRLQSIHTLISENTAWIKQLQDQLYTDQLTGLYTKYFLETEVVRLLKPPVSIILIKPDRFKELNDIFGHKAGDAVLARIGTLLLDVFDTGYSGWAVRMQSNETALILQETDTKKATELARTLRLQFLQIGPSRLQAAQKEGKQTDMGKEFRLTVSIAIGSFRQKNENFRNLLNAVHGLMQQAWKQGGNKLCVLDSYDTHHQG